MFSIINVGTGIFLNSKKLEDVANENRRITYRNHIRRAD